MKKVVYNKYGNFDDLQIVDVEIPSIQSDEFLIKVKSVSINPLDWKKLEGQLKIITGNKFPKVIAFDFSGVVEKAGDNATNFKIGDAVFGALNAMKGEALAEYIVVRGETIYKKPDSISFETAAAVVSVGSAAIYLLNEAKVEKGDDILINGASGGVGLLALQMAKKRGIKVTAVASGEGLTYVKRWSPEKTIDYKHENVLRSTQKYNAIFELAGSLPFGRAKMLLKSNSVYVSTLPNPIDMLTAFFNNIFSSKKNIMVKASPTQEVYRELCDWLTQKNLELTIAKIYSMNEFMEAYMFAKKGGIIGKVVFNLK